jgi:hypothetical protein
LSPIATLFFHIFGKKNPDIRNNILCFSCQLKSNF